MTGEELDKTIQFLLDSHATLTAQTQMNAENIALLSTEIRMLAFTVMKHSDQAETDRHTWEAKFEATRKEWKEEAEADRRLMREMIQGLKDSIRMESDRTDRRVDALDKRMEKLESA
jgi:hypothetical protein